MKYIRTYLLLLLVTVCNTVQAQQTHEDTLNYLSKTWMVKEVVDPSFTDKEDEEEFRQFLKSLRIQFKKDGRMTAGDGKESMNGRWVYDREKKVVKMTLEGQDTVILQIEQLSATVFKFINKNDGNGGVPSGTFIPAK